MWLQVKAPATQMHSADGTCQLQIFVTVKSQQSFACVCVRVCTRLQFGSDSQTQISLGIEASEKRCKKHKGIFFLLFILLLSSF